MVRRVGAADMAMQRFKHSTAELHSQVESALNPTLRFGTRAAYGQLLRRLRPFYVTIEQMLATLSWSAIGFDFESRRKAPLLTADLSALGEPIEDAREARSPVEIAYPVLMDLASGFGTLYVLEGATLGGRVLRKVIRANLDIDCSNGGSFYEGYGDDTQTRWREFGAALDDYCRDSKQRFDSAEAAAFATFTAIGCLLSAPRPFPPRALSTSA